MGFIRDNSFRDCGGAIDVEGNIMYSTIGRRDEGLEPVGSPISNNYGLFRYSIDTTYGGYVRSGVVVIPGLGPTVVYYSVWINSYLDLTSTGSPLELFVDGDYAFCSFDRDSLYFIKIDSVEGYDPKYNVIPIYNYSFNDFKTNGDFLYAVAESLSASWYKGMLFAIRIYRRNHCVPSGTYKRSTPYLTNIPLYNIIKCFPNPFNKSINIIVNSSNKFILYVYDISGFRIWSYKGNAKNTKQTIVWEPDRNVSSGVYLIKYIDQELTIYKKIILLK